MTFYSKREYNKNMAQTYKIRAKKKKKWGKSITNGKKLK